MTQVGQLRSDQNILAANGYIGRNVTVNDKDGNPVTGMVTAVDSDPTAGVSLTVNGQSYDLSSLRRIEAAATPPTTGTTP